jgi:hypothetical protein
VSKIHNGMKKIIFLHHSTGKNIWLGKTSRYTNKLFNKSDVKDYFAKYNRQNNTDYHIREQKFPKESPYGWKNNPFDYYNIWVKHSGPGHYLGEPTLEILTRDYDTIIFKHCYPASRILPDSNSPDINSELKTLQNYKLQYNALKMKMHEFPDNKFIVWTPAVFLKNQMTVDEAKRTQEFHHWLLNDWNEKGDNIFIWDFYRYETDGNLYMVDEYSEGPSNSHPNKEFSERISPLFSKFVIDVLEDKAE